MDTKVCDTCIHHERQSSRVDFMWGAGWAFVVVIGTIVSIMLMGITSNSKHIELNANRIARHELLMNNGLHDLRRAITIMSINQKRQMEESGLNYIDPDPLEPN